MKPRNFLFGITLTVISLFSCSGETTPDPLQQQTSDKTHKTLANDQSMFLTWKDTTFTNHSEEETEVGFILTFEPKFISDIGTVTYAFLTYESDQKEHSILLDTEYAIEKNGSLIFDSELKEKLTYVFPFVIPSTINGKNASENNLTFVFSYHETRYSCPYIGTAD